MSLFGPRPLLMRYLSAMTVRAVTAAAGVDAPSCAPEFMGTGAGDRGRKGAG